MNVNPVTEQLWIFNSTHLIFIDFGLNFIKAVEAPEFISNIVFDDAGNGYMGGEGFIVKYDR